MLYCIGFKESRIACCGTGPYRGMFSCGGKRSIKEYKLCENVSEYVFFDSIHPSEKASQQFVELSGMELPISQDLTILKNFLKISECRFE